MDEEGLLPGLVRVIEERLGAIGRPFTTIMVISAGLGIIAWGAGTVYGKVVEPAISFFGVQVDSELATGLVAVGALVAIFVIGILAVSYGIERIRRGGVHARLQKQEQQIRELRTLVESRECESEDGPIL